MPIDPRMVKWEDAPAKAGKIDLKSVEWDDAPADAAKAKGEKAPSWMKAGNSLLQGATFGFGDELSGLAGGASAALLKLLPDVLAAKLDPRDQALRAASLGDAYRMTRDAARGMNDQFAKDAPLTNAALQAAGGFAVPISPLTAVASVPGMSRVAQSASNVIKGPMLRMGAQAASSGAVSGAIGGVGNADSMDDALDSALQGAMTGGAAGPAVGALAGGGGAIVNNIRSRFSEGAAGDMARRRIAEAIARDETTAQRMGARINKLGDRAVIADSGGENVRNLLDTVAVMPGQTGNRVEQVIRGRQAGRGAALIGSAEKAMETEGQRLAPATAAWIAEREQLASPLYKRLYAMSVTPDAELSSIVRAADELGATKLARDIATARQMPYTLDRTAPPASSVTNMTRTQSDWSMRDLDHIKQALDTKISQKVDKVDGGLTPEGSALVALRDALKSKLDNLTGGAYADARAAFAGPSAIMDASQAGRRAMLGDDTSIRQAVAGLQGSELEAFKLGAFESLRAKLGKMAGQTEILNMWRDSATREKLQALFPNERAFRQFASTTAAEARLKGLERVGRGSQTARREAGFDDLNSATARDSFDLAASLKTGNPLGVLERASRIYGRVATPEPVRDAIGRSLLTPQSLAAPELQSIEQMAAEVAARRNAQAAASGTSGAAGLRALLGL
jgi:hypothetical protein